MRMRNDALRRPAWRWNENICSYEWVCWFARATSATSPKTGFSRTHATHLCVRACTTMSIIGRSWLLASASATRAPRIRGAKQIKGLRFKLLRAWENIITPVHMRGLLELNSLFSRAQRAITLGINCASAWSVSKRKLEPHCVYYLSLASQSGPQTRALVCVCLQISKVYCNNKHVRTRYFADARKCCAHFNWFIITYIIFM